MAALVQSFPSPSSTITMLQTRPTSSDAFQSGSQGQQHQRGSQMPRNMYNTSIGGMATTNYRGHTSLASVPVAPYAFSGTPVLPGSSNPLRQHPTVPHLRQENRTTSAPAIPVNQQSSNTLSNPGRYRPHDSSTSTTPSHPGQSKDDSAILSQASKQFSPRPLSSIELNAPSLSPNPSTTVPAKPSPDRYRRNHRRAETTGLPSTNVSSPSGSALPSGSGMATVGHLYSNSAHSSSSPSLSTYSTYRGTPSPSNHNQSAVDDTTISKQGPNELAKRYRRRSISSMDVGDYKAEAVDVSSQFPGQTKTYAAMLAGPPSQERKESRPSALQRPSSSHGRKDSAESSISGRSSSRPSSSKREVAATVPASTSVIQQATPVAGQAKIVNIPPRGSSEANKRLTNPSPLSQPLSPSSPGAGSNRNDFTAAVQQMPTTPSLPPAAQNIGPESAAAQSLAGLNKRDAKKEGKSSRLRRAFSFGSAAELRKSSAENSLKTDVATERAKLRKDRYQDEREAEQAAIAQKQEASGLGEGIYSGQGQFFTGSTDNLSISSTASSASVMIRKMGKGMKKGSRSLVGLFRPKSVVGVPAADSAVPEPSVAQVSMVTVEAEREKVNVNVKPDEQTGGGTGFPKLERNSLDAASVAMEPTPLGRNDFVTPRRSIVGGEKERAEVLAAVKKGILKRAGTDSSNSSPTLKPMDARGPEPVLAQAPRFSESPRSSSPSTPADDHPPRLGHRRTDSVTIEGEDYFMSLARFASGESKSVPGTPRSIAARNISFSPRIQFHDTWPSGEYDRRGEVATCNRLTPMLAQQIKEELNTFKMEMEVHEQSKVYTHFF